LRDDEQLFNARLHEFFRLAQHVARRPRHEIAAQAGDDAEGAPVVAALRDLQIGVMARRELHALRGHQVEEWIVRGGGRLMHGADDAFVILRAGDRKKVGIGAADLAGLRAHAASDDDTAVFGHGGPDGRKRFGLSAIEKAAGVDDNGVRAGVTAGELVALGPQLRENALGIDERLGTAERDEGDFGRKTRRR